MVSCSYACSSSLSSGYFVPSGLCSIELHLRGNHISFNISMNHTFLRLVAPTPKLTGDTTAIQLDCCHMHGF